MPSMVPFPAAGGGSAAVARGTSPVRTGGPPVPQAAAYPVSAAVQGASPPCSSTDVPGPAAATLCRQPSALRLENARGADHCPSPHTRIQTSPWPRDFKPRRPWAAWPRIHGMRGGTRGRTSKLPVNQGLGLGGMDHAPPGF